MTVKQKGLNGFVYVTYYDFWRKKVGPYPTSITITTFLRSQADRQLKELLGQHADYFEFFTVTKL